MGTDDVRRTALLGWALALAVSTMAAIVIGKAFFMLRDVFAAFTDGF